MKTGLCKIVFSVVLFFDFVYLARAQDPYELLRQEAAGFETVVAGREFIFPVDHFPHESFKIEWWYLTANLEDSEGNDYGVHWTLFRQAMNPRSNLGGWQSNQTWMAHSALSTPTGFSFSQRFSRGGIGQAGVATSSDGIHFEAWMDDWVWKGSGLSPIPGNLYATTPEGRFELSMSSSNQWVLQGDAGFSQKSEHGQASYYYSQPSIEITGTLWQHEEQVSLKGKGWLDREWSSQPLAENQPGWDWISLHLDDGSELMAYQLRQDNDDNYISGSWVDPIGRYKFLGQEQIIFKPLRYEALAIGRSKKLLPLRWLLEVPSLNINLTFQALYPNSWLNTAFPYWEGPVRASGSHNGHGYLELTGY